MDALISQFDLFLSEIIEKAQLTAPFSLGVAVSGGADSMALAYLTQQWAKKYGIFIKTVTVDHNLRPESASEAQQVHQWLEKWKIPHEILLWAPPKDQKITHEEARTGRYHLLIQWCLKNHIPMLLLAHHALDQAETILMRFCKSSHLRGLRGMDRLQKKDGVFLARPLLEIWPDKLRQFLKSLDQKWIEDPSNQNPKYLRTHARQILLDPKSPPQKLGLTPQRLLNWSEKMSESHQVIMIQVKGLLEKHFQHSDIDFYLDKKAFFALDPVLQSHVLETIFIDFLGLPLAPRWSSIKTLCQRLCHEKPSTLGGYKFSIDKKNIIISSEQQK